MSSNNLKSRSTGGQKSEASDKSQLLDPVDSEDMRATTSKEDVNTGGDMDTGSGQASMIRIGRYNINKVVAVTHVNIFLYSSCFWIQQAVFPYLSKQLGADPVVFGYLQTTFAVVQLAGGPLFGRFGDLFGSRMAMTLAFLAAAASYFLLYASVSMTILFLSRLPSVFMHAMQGGQMIVTDVCTSKERAAALGKLGISYGVGMVLGPMAGGLISKFFSLETGALVACLGSLLSVVLIFTFVPPQVKKTSPTPTQSSAESVFSIKKIAQLLSAPRALFLMGIKLGTGIPIGIFQSMFAVVALETFKLPPETNSAIMSYIGVMGMIVQGVGIGYVTQKVSEHTILLGSAGLLAVSYLLLSQVTDIYQMCVVFIPLTCGLTFQNVVTTSALTHTVPDTDTGAMLGLSMATNSLIRSISPTVGGLMLNNLGFPSFGYLGFVMCVAVTGVLYVRRGV